MKSALFIHRSVGQNLINKGRLRECLTDTYPHLAFSDYNQNNDILTDSNGEKQKCDFIFPGTNTKPKDYAEIFSAEVGKKYMPIQAFALKYDLVLLKSCFPNSNIKSDEQLEQIKSNYRHIADFFAKHPDKQLVIITSPPLIPLLTTKARAQRARQLANWLARTKWTKNIAVFNFYDLLAYPKKNWLRRPYRRPLLFDAHPNAKASRTIAPLLVDFMGKIKL